MRVTPSPSSTDTSGKADLWRSAKIDSPAVAPASLVVEASAVAVVASAAPVISVAVEALAVVAEASVVASAAVAASVVQVVLLLALLLASVVVSTRLLLQYPRTPSPTLLPLPVKRARLSMCAT